MSPHRASRRQPMHGRVWLGIAGLALACAAALCACSRPRRDAPRPVEATSSRVDVFLRCSDPGSTPIAIEVASLALRDDAGELHPLEVTRASVRSSESERRLKLGGAIVPPANYDALMVELKSATLERGGPPLALALTEADEVADPVAPAASKTYAVPVRLRVERRQAASLFLEWRADNSLAGGTAFVPAFALTLETRQTTLGLLYVADEGSGSVLSIDRATGEVVGSFKAGDRPVALALANDRRSLFVANAGDGSLTLIDTRLGVNETSFPIAFGARTSDVVLGDSGRIAAATNPGRDSVSLVTLGGASSFDVGVGRSPIRLAAAPSLGRVYVADEGSDTLSVVDVNSRTLVASVRVDSRPSAVAVDSKDEEVYVGHALSANLIVLDASALSQVASIFVGNNVSDLLVDRFKNRVYVARSRPNEIIVVERRLGAMVRRIPLSAGVRNLAQSREGSRLYCAAPDAGSVLIVDLVMGKEEPPIRCGSRPSDVAIVE